MTSILTNVAAMAASRQIGLNSAGLQKTVERLTTGKRINRASDDASGLATGQGLYAAAKTQHEARVSANNSFYAQQALDGYLEEATNLALRATELVAGGNTGAELTQVNTLASAAASAGGFSSYANITDAATSSTALGSINTQRSSIAGEMAKYQSRANMAGISEENFTAQAGGIMDADIGAEVVNLAKFQILQQAGISALSQANQSSQAVLALLR